MADRLPQSARDETLRAMGITVWRRAGVHNDPPELALHDTETVTAAEAVTAASPVATAQPIPDWETLRHSVLRCTRCRLHETRTQSVFGVGDTKARLMIVGEAPGAEEDRQGEPFVGRAGNMLDSMLRAINIEREQVFIANVIKCRPPQNRDPRADEVSACADYLTAQIAHVAPELILAVGRVAAQHLLGSTETLAKMRNVRDLAAHGVPVIVTYHPAYLLRTPAQKGRGWEDLKRVREQLGGSG